MKQEAVPPGFLLADEECLSEIIDSFMFQAPGEDERDWSSGEMARHILQELKPDKIPNFNEAGPGNPVTAIELRMKDGAVLRFRLPDVQQSRVMWAIGKLLAGLEVPLDLEIPPQPGEQERTGGA